MSTRATAAKARERNRRFYDGLWADAQLVAPHRFNTWPHLEHLTGPDVARLELGPGLRPRLPIEGTDFVDLSEPALTALRAAGGKTHLASVENLPFADDRFDVVAALDVIEHAADLAATLTEIRRVTRPSGELWLSVPLHLGEWQAFDDIVGHCHRSEPDELVELLTRAGLKIEASAAYGRKPRAPKLVDRGMRQLAKNPRRAMGWYNRVVVPIALRHQKPIEWQPGLLEVQSISEVLLRCRRVAPAQHHCQLERWQSNICGRPRLSEHNRLIASILCRLHKPTRVDTTSELTTVRGWHSIQRPKP